MSFTTHGKNTVGSSSTLPQYVSYLPTFGLTRQLSAGGTSDRVGLTSGLRAVRLCARGADVRFAVGTFSVVASNTDHFLAEGYSIEFPLRSGDDYIAAIRASTVDGALEISELG